MPDCKQCETSFEAAHPTATYCSNKCRQAAKYKRKRDVFFTVKCRQCAVELFTNDRRLKYCSIECRAIAKIIRN